MKQCVVVALSVLAFTASAVQVSRQVRADPTGQQRNLRFSIPRVTGQVHAYATFEPIGKNLLPLVAETAREEQTVTLGQSNDGEFVPAVRFGVVNHKGILPGYGFLVAWAHDNRFDYFGEYVRPKTAYDFKLDIDLPSRVATVWASGRGDDAWFLVADAVPLINPVPEINAVQVDQAAGASGVREVIVQTEPIAAREMVQAYPLAKKSVVAEGQPGFRFQSMRSIWNQSGKHVVVFRKPAWPCIAPDVAEAEPGHLFCVWTNGSHTGGAGGLSLTQSEDSGKTWGEAQSFSKLESNAPRIQRLKDGTLLLETDVSSGHGGEGELDWHEVFWESHDNGRTWATAFQLDPVKAGANGAGAEVCSRTLEVSDGSWMIACQSIHGMQPYKMTHGNQLEVYRSENQGSTWQLWSTIQLYPPHSVDEPSILEMPDGRLAIWARENRNDGFPAIKAYSRDKGRTWKAQELPFAVNGRTSAGYLRDGRIMFTFRSEVGREALWAWIGDADDPTTAQPAGVHLNDQFSKGLKDGALHIDSDGDRGQFTRYMLRQPDSPQSTIDITVEVEVRANRGRAATLSIPYVGKVRIFPDHVEMAHEPALRASVAPGEFHTYRAIRTSGRMQLYIDGKKAWDTDKVDARTAFSAGWAPEPQSLYALAFGNEAGVVMPKAGFIVNQNVLAPDVLPEVTGYSIWKRVESIIDDPKSGKSVMSWSGSSGKFPDQYQLDHILEIQASDHTWDQGYSGWLQFDDGRVFLVNYTDDKAPASRPYGRQFIMWDNPDEAKAAEGIMVPGVTWVRGTFLNASDLQMNPN